MSDGIIVPGDLGAGFRKGRRGHEPWMVALDGANVSIQAGELVATVAHSGSQKCTLLNMICLLDAPNIGQIFLKGIDVSEQVPKSEPISAIRSWGPSFNTTTSSRRSPPRRMS